VAPYIRIGGIKRSDADPSPSVFLYLLFGRLFTTRKRVDIRKILPGYVRIGGSQLARIGWFKTRKSTSSMRSVT
jgi:hypothetical protein